MHKDEAEAEHVLEWLRKEINDAWDNREKITPMFTGKAKPLILEIYKLLPKSNCRECGQPTCMMFASLATEGIKGWLTVHACYPPARIRLMPICPGSTLRNLTCLQKIPLTISSK